MMKENIRHGNKIDPNENAFDLLRIIGAYIVLFSHSFRHFGVTKPIWSLFFTDGATGVMIFFAMTGFVIMPAWERQQQKEHPLFRFYWNRLIRIFPAIFFSFVLITFANIYIIGENILSINYILYSIKYCVFSIGGGYGLNGISNGVLWTIIPDIVYYLLTPIIWKLMKDQKIWVWLVVIFIFWQFNVWDTQVIRLFQNIPLLGLV